MCSDFTASKLTLGFLSSTMHFLKLYFKLFIFLPVSTISSCVLGRLPAGPSPAGEPVVPGPPFKICAPPFHVWPPVVAYIQYCILSMCPPLWFLVPCCEIVATGLYTSYFGRHILQSSIPTQYYNRKHHKSTNTHYDSLTQLSFLYSSTPSCLFRLTLLCLFYATFKHSNFLFLYCILCW